jgi:hypothetical protein
MVVKKFIGNCARCDEVKAIKKMPRFFDAIQWQQPWFTAILPMAKRLIVAPDWRFQLNLLADEFHLMNHQGMPIQFVHQHELPDGMAYESLISTTGKVPTRENLHDFFNALVWLTFPNIKCQLNALQAAQIKQLGIGKSRGAARDAATIFDENCALLVLDQSIASDQLLNDLRAHRWHAALYEQATIFGTHAEIWSFGHALIEKLVHPYKAITAHAWVVRVSSDFFVMDDTAKRRVIDQCVTAQLRQRDLRTTDYTSLPVLGIPQWWHNQSTDFYADASVFRPPKKREENIFAL